MLAYLLRSYLTLSAGSDLGSEKILTQIFRNFPPSIEFQDITLKIRPQPNFVIFNKYYYRL
jgi:hypothetical protein